MQVLPTLGFASAYDKKPGDFVAMGGKAHRIVEVVHTGRNWPYFRLEGVAPNFYLCFDSPGLISWQVLGDVAENNDV